MIHEVRDIILSLDEVFTAFNCYQRITPDFLPLQSIVGCRTGDNEVTLTVEPISGDAAKRAEATFRGIDVLRPLIRFCIENNIMLPRDGKKSILIEADCIRLHIELNLHIDMPASLNPLRVSNLESPVHPATEKMAAV